MSKPQIVILQGLNQLKRRRKKTAMTKPVTKFADAEQEFPEFVVWGAVLDERYQIEVIRLNDYSAELRIFDHEAEDLLVHSEQVGLSYGAIFGPDTSDVADWQEKSALFVDSLKIDMDVHT